MRVKLFALSSRDGLQTKLGLVRDGRDLTDHSDAADWNDHRCIILSCDGCSRIVGIVDELDFSDRDWVTGRWRYISPSHRCNGG